MYAITQFLSPACLTREQYWIRLLILVPILIAWSVFALSVVEANGTGTGLPPIGIFINLAIIGAVIARLRHVGITWLIGLGSVLGVLFILAPIAVVLASAAAKKVFGIDALAGPNVLQTIMTGTNLVQLPFAVVALAAGFLKGDPERLLKRLGERIARSPGSAKHYLTRGKFLADLERKDEALADFGMALKLKPKMKAAQQAKDYVEGLSDGQKSAFIE